MESQLNIPVTSSIADFLVHLKSHPRTILSAKYGDGKSYFLNELRKTQQQDYVFLTIYPINYQVEENKDIFELVKKDILLQLIMNEMIEDDFEISDSVALSFYLQYNRKDIGNELIHFISGIFGTLDYKPALLFASSVNLFKALKAKFEEYKKQCEKGSSVDTFLSKVQQFHSIECDAITQIIHDAIEAWKEKNKKNVVLVFEDMDRIDPAHLFRILNILSAHMDYCNKSGLAADDSLAGNKFGVDNVVVVLDYENLKSIFHHFYGEHTCFAGYINKFASSGYFRYSFSEQRNLFIYEEINRITGLPTDSIKKILKEDWLNSREMRRIVDSMRGVEFQIMPIAKYTTKSGNHRICSGKMLKLYVIMRRLAIGDDDIILSISNFLSDDYRNLRYFAAYALTISPESPFRCIMCTEDDSADVYICTTFDGIDDVGDAEMTQSRNMGRPTKYVQYSEIAKSLFGFISK